MRRLFLLSILSLKIFGLSNCSGASHTSPQQLANQKSLDDLALLVSNNPELSEASLQEIKNNAEKPHALTPRDINFALDTQEHETHIKPEVAKKAQILIDDILDQFDFATELSAGFKIMGIVINMQKERLKQFEAYAKSLDMKGDDGMSKFDPNAAPKNISCEAFMANPFTKIPKEKYDEMALANRELIKKTLSGCPSLITEKFIQCTGTFNNITSLVNQYATCDLENMDELEQLLDHHMGGLYQEKKKALFDCLNVQFSSCGFEMKKISN
jgi:hypothetical protein